MVYYFNVVTLQTYITDKGGTLIKYQRGRKALAAIVEKVQAELEAAMAEMNKLTYQSGRASI